MKQPLIFGSVLIPSDISAFENGELHIILEDTTYADSEALPIEETVVREVVHKKGSVEKETIQITDNEDINVTATTVPFRLSNIRETVNIDPKKSYSVRAWLTIAGGDQEESLFLFSDQAYPVLTYGFGHKLQILLRSK